MLVITGFDTSGTKVTYIDPATAASYTVSYSMLVSNGTHTWTHSLYKTS